MTTLAARKRREKSNTNKKRAQQTFNAPGVYQPIFGKTSIYISGHGQAGNTTQNSNVAFYNPDTPGNVSGNNPAVPGNFVSTNPSVPGNFAGTNPPTPKQIDHYNPSSGHNIAGYNPNTPGNQAFNPPVPGQIVEDHTFGPPGFSVSDTFYVSGYFTIAPFNSFNPSNQWFNVTTVSRPSGFFVPGTSFYNPSVGGNAYYNPTTPGNAVYNPAVPGTAYFNPTVPGNANYNTPTPSNSNFNPSVPGNANFNNVIPGAPGVPFTALGVSFPGGNTAAAAPVVGRTLTYAPYLAAGAGYPINVEPGGVVIIEET